MKGLHARLLEDCDRLLRVGQLGEAVLRLRGLVTGKVERRWRLPIAKLCRRAELNSLGLKLLTPLLFPEKFGVAQIATIEERAEYAVLLMKIGSVDEAINLLSDISPSDLPEAELYRAFCHMAHWNYKPAAFHLRSYLACELQPYAALIARVNLAAALTSTKDFAEALGLLDELIRTTSAQDLGRLRANCLELRSQIYLEQSEPLACERDLNEASAILARQATTDQLYIEKWKAVLRARKDGSPDALLAFKSEAIRRRSWENVRAADFQILRISLQQDLFEHLIWGTPYLAYCERVCTDLGLRLLSDHYVFGKADSSRSLDLRMGLSSPCALKPGQIVHRVLAILLRDFYRPVSIGTVHVALFPNEHFNIFSSSDRVHQAIHRTRGWLKKNRIPVAIEATEGQFSLKMTGDFRLIIDASREGVTSESHLLARLRSAFGTGQMFSSRHARETLGLSSTTVVSLLNSGVTSGQLQKVGTGRSTRYRFAAAESQSDTPLKPAA